MINYWKKIPEQVKRLSILILILIITFFFVQSTLVPTDFGEYGHYRGSALNEIASQELKYAGQLACN